MTDAVDCPNCGTEIEDIVAAAYETEPCPGCDKPWSDLCAIATGDINDPEDATVEYPFDGPGGVRT